MIPRKIILPCAAIVLGLLPAGCKLNYATNDGTNGFNYGQTIPQNPKPADAPQANPVLAQPFQAPPAPTPVPEIQPDTNSTAPILNPAAPATNNPVTGNAPGISDGFPQPPPLRDELTPTSPGFGYVWIPGSWAWHDQQWVWVSGRWRRPTWPSSTWVPGRWENRNGKVIWNNGHWQ